MEISRREAWLGIGAIVVLLASILIIYSTDTRRAESAGSGTGDGHAAASVIDQVLDQKTGFQLLIVYTDQGFNPAHVTIKRGDTVRFFNEASGDMWVIAAPVHNGGVYSKGPAACAESDFDSCGSYGHHGYWEFTFDEPGVWGYVNGNDVAHAGALEVR